MTQEEQVHNFWIESAKGNSRFLNPNERSDLRMKSRAEAARNMEVGDYLQAGQALRVLLTLGGATSRELDLIGLALLREIPAPDQSPLIARILLRHFEDGAERLELNAEDAQRVKDHLQPDGNRTDISNCLLASSPKAMAWLDQVDP